METAVHQSTACTRHDDDDDDFDDGSEATSER